MVRVEKLGERVAKVLAARLIKGSAGNGEVPLPTEREISDEFGVSKTVAREVVAHLTSMKLVETHHGRRMRLLPDSDWNYLHPMMLELQDVDGTRRLVSELFDVRLLIEPETAARAAIDATEEHHVRMARLLDLMRDSVDRPDEYLLTDVAFHQEILSSSKNRLLAHILDSVQHLMFQSRRATGMATEARVRATEFHTAVYEAIRDRDPERARSAMRTHLIAGALEAGIIPTAPGIDDAAKTANLAGVE